MPSLIKYHLILLDSNSNYSKVRSVMLFQVYQTLISFEGRLFLHACTGNLLPFCRFLFQSSKKIFKNTDIEFTRYEKVWNWKLKLLCRRTIVSISYLMLNFLHFSNVCSFLTFQFYSDYFYKAPQDAIVKTLVRNRVDTYMYVQNTTVEALKLPWWRQITHNLEHYFLSGAPFMDPVFFSEDQQVLHFCFL